MKIRSSAALAAAASSVLLLSACSTSTDDSASASSDSDLPLIAASFYPLQFVAEQVGGDLIDVLPLAQPGVEPHDLELSPATVRSLSKADLVLYLTDFQAAVDDAIESTGVTGLDVTDYVTLMDGDDEDEHEDEEHEDEEEEEHDHGDVDPHFWLDPTLLAEYADAVADAFGEIDPDNADTYTANAEALNTELEQIDADYTEGLASCERTTIVTSHSAFGYLAAAYGLTQESIAGIDPDTEPSPARLRELRTIVEETGTTTVFTEDAVSANVAKSLAEDAGVETTVLSPIETVADGEDYIEVMNTNLETLRSALGCS
ncbi:metal ABC transporter substrate-binding protein [Demequina sp. NBRC 110054]|uniref:metal ABC transporter substrate-binding protein n=1 Tax=Demequina sp. NBRC 110054 TaxID=1570343 RepID=UPI0009FD0B5F|nr:metal ABC transporter substrate-binding protein [Demequina sp. NBRC 110054]